MLPILIIYTGGTIGMQPSASGYQTSSGMSKLIANAFNSNALEQLKPFEVLEFTRLIDSSNAQPNDWLAIAQCIDDNYRQYAGFIVLHGTDTMAYTAAALHHMLGENIKPVIVTGSQIPMCEARSDGPSNIQDAILFARSGNVHQVCLSFAGKLIAGACAKKVDSSALAAFSSDNSRPLAVADISLSFTERHSQLNPSLSENRQLSFKLAPLQQQSVAVLLLYPGISKASIDAALLDKNIKAVVMLSYGAGNPPDQNSDLIKALETAVERGVVVINMTQCYRGKVAQGTYAVGSVLNKLGIISALDRTLEDVVTDLYINLKSYQ